jgi:hypothetical protein
MRKRSVLALLGALFGLLTLALVPWGASASLPFTVHKPNDTGVLGITATPTDTPLPGCTVAWRVVSSPNPGPLDNRLNAVSALSPNNAWAVGYYLLEDGHSRKTLVEHWNGARWHVEPSLNYGPDPYGNELRGVVALAPNDVWAVGWYYGPFFRAHTLIEHWDGSLWSIVPSPDSNPKANYLDSVSASAPDDIWAVGYSESLSSIYPRTLALHWDGTQWDVVPTPNTSEFTNSLHGVTSIAKNDAWAVGYYYDPDTSTSHSLVQHWDGTQWSIVQDFDAGAYGDLEAVQALAPDDIWAVGYRGEPGSADRTLIEHWDGSAWSIVPSPNVGSGANELYAVNGIASNDVWAVGNIFENDGDLTLVLHWNGTQWNVVPSPSPGSLINNLRGVAEVSREYVWAVGDSFSSGGDTQTAIQRYRASCGPPVPTNTPLPTPTACTPPAFTDVPTSSPFYPFIACLSCRGVVSGYADGTFRPSNSVTRGQSAKMVVLARGWQINITGGPHFTDVRPGDTFYPYVETAYNHQVISGYSDGTFRPGNNITRGQLAKVVALAAGFHGLAGFQVFEDVPPDHAFFDYVQWLGVRQVMGGYRCTSGSQNEPCVPPYERKYFRPGNDATRAQTSKIIANAFFPECGTSEP